MGIRMTTFVHRFTEMVPQAIYMTRDIDNQSLTRTFEIDHDSNYILSKTGVLCTMLK